MLIQIVHVGQKGRELPVPALIGQVERFIAVDLIVACAAQGGVAAAEVRRAARCIGTNPVAAGIGDSIGVGSMTDAWAMHATMRIAPWQAGQVGGSTSKICCNTAAQRRVASAGSAASA